MPHRAETILDTVTTLLTGLATTGTNVYRARVYPVDAFPAITVEKGEDIAREAEDAVLDTVLREMVLRVVMHVNQNTNVETTLHQVAAEVYAALAADATLGLSYVFDCDIIGDDAPEIEDSQDLPVARLVSNWAIFYEHSKTSAET